ncbi:putative DMT superfamily transporter inner membrane protein [Marinomonas aquimarina]|uniref:Putative DMT superfamily transporter inner membrane protein n=1 Tax=Marinomonas aquimarina TaxID=295068 RepID=A0A1A8T1Q8_9GAMM|nr:DMT family transporter [Marinomonas aquimarina]SBS24534.1 putative DMT superfamily transporter inner membrane protein [Marinomonas aquimarina]
MSIAHLFLWLTAIIWGFAFVAQSTAMDVIGPHTFNAVRFLLATLSLIPLLFIFKSKQAYDMKGLIKGSLAAGTLLFCGFTFQQTGLLYTTAGNAGFITSMYIVLVPLVGLLFKHAVDRLTWLGIAVALAGFYVLTIGPNLTINKGDALEFAGTLFWTLHVLLIGFLSRSLPALPLSIMQFAVATVWASLAAFALETPTLSGIELAWWPLVYAGVASSGIAFTLQTLGQRQVTPSTTALILSMEAVFAVIGGWLFMGEILSDRALFGCALIFTGMIVSQWPRKEVALTTATTKETS